MGFDHDRASRLDQSWLQGSSTALRLRYELAASFDPLRVRNCAKWLEQCVSFVEAAGRAKLGFPFLEAVESCSSFRVAGLMHPQATCRARRTNFFQFCASCLVTLGDTMRCCQRAHNMGKDGPLDKLERCIARLSIDPFTLAKYECLGAVLVASSRNAYGFHVSVLVYRYDLVFCVHEMNLLYFGSEMKGVTRINASDIFV